MDRVSTSARLCDTAPVPCAIAGCVGLASRPTSSRLHIFSPPQPPSRTRSSRLRYESKSITRRLPTTCKKMCFTLLVMLIVSIVVTGVLYGRGLSTLSQLERHHAGMSLRWTIVLAIHFALVTLLLLYVRARTKLMAAPGWAGSHALLLRVIPTCWLALWLGSICYLNIAAKQSRQDHSYGVDDLHDHAAAADFATGLIAFVSTRRATPPHPHPHPPPAPPHPT